MGLTMEKQLFRACLNPAKLGLIAVLVLLSGCFTPYNSKKVEASRIENNVRQMAAAIAHDLGKDGPIAWLRYFSDEPGFFMAVNGKLQFADLKQAKDFLPGFSQ